MRTITRTLFSIAAGTMMIYFAGSIQAQIVRDQSDVAGRFARHFLEKPPVRFEVEQSAEHGPRIIITNSYQYPLTAFIVRRDPAAASDITNTLIYDGLARMGLRAPIPAGLSFVMGVPHPVAESVPDPVLAAAVWEDGSTFGPDELLVRISSSRTTLADSYDRAIAVLQAGLDKNWTAEAFLEAAKQMNPSMSSLMADTPGNSTAEIMPSHTITVNMQHAIQHDRSPGRVARLARSLLKEFTQTRDSLRQALSGQSTSVDQTSNR